MTKIVGRKYEIEILQESLKSSNSELIAVYGRRRVGKTFLIREIYANQIKFEVTGLYQGELSDQLANFTKELKKTLN
ncbi:MAG: ATP-binding protein [Vicingaceae bacterium]|nr:ATP-binding protein [Vicingaceae bacterium]